MTQNLHAHRNPAQSNIQSSTGLDKDPGGYGHGPGHQGASDTQNIYTTGPEMIKEETVASMQTVRHPPNLPPNLEAVPMIDPNNNSSKPRPPTSQGDSHLNFQSSRPPKQNYNSNLPNPSFRPPQPNGNHPTKNKEPEHDSAVTPLPETNETEGHRPEASLERDEPVQDAPPNAANGNPNARAHTNGNANPQSYQANANIGHNTASAPTSNGTADIHSSEAALPSNHPGSANKEITVINVYKGNLMHEFHKIRQLVKKYRNIALDTEFPGVCMFPDTFAAPRDIKEEKYLTIKANVDALNLIQLGLCFLDDNGELAPDCSVWQFNFHFQQQTDMFNEESIQMLKTAGLDFEKLSTEGIPRYAFAELFTSSGLCMNKNVNWLLYHGAYDILYLMRIFRDDHPLPMNFDPLMELVKLVFPNIYDIKYICRKACLQESGLASIAEQHGVKRYGDAHQAGSDSLMTGQTFFELRKTCKNIEFETYKNVIFGIGEGITDSERIRHDRQKQQYHSRHMYPSSYDSSINYSGNIQEQSSNNQRLFTRMPQTSNAGPQVTKANSQALTPTPPPGSDKSLDKNNNLPGKLDVAEKKRLDTSNLVNSHPKP